MSKLIATAAIRASHSLVDRADEMLQKAIAAHGENFAFEFPDTDFNLRYICDDRFSVKTIGDMKTALGFAKECSTMNPMTKCGCLILGKRSISGMSTLFAEEILLALRYIEGLEPVKDLRRF